jgi:hypothetical protein
MDIGFGEESIDIGFSRDTAFGESPEIERDTGFGENSTQETSQQRKGRRNASEVQKDPIWTYFEQSPLSQKFKCKMCSTLLIKTLTNLKRHLKGIHQYFRQTSE